jgi:hypothetical protein
MLRGLSYSFAGHLVAPAPQQHMQPMQQAWGGMPAAHAPRY